MSSRKHKDHKGDSKSRVETEASTSRLGNIATHPILNIPNDGSFLERFKKMQEEDAKGSKKLDSLNIKNDGNFLENFNRMQEEMKEPMVKLPRPNKLSEEDRDFEWQNCRSHVKEPIESPLDKPHHTSAQTSSTSHEVKQPKVSMISKRKIGGSRVLKTGVVEKKLKMEEASDSSSGKDARSQYMSELEKYKMEDTIGEQKSKWNIHWVAFLLLLSSSCYTAVNSRGILSIFHKCMTGDFPQGQIVHTGIYGMLHLWSIALIPLEFCALVTTVMSRLTD